MRTLLGLLFVLGSLSAHANSDYLYECNAKALAAAQSIDSLNFESSSSTSAGITDLSQKKNSAKISISLGEAKNRHYIVKLSKNRGAKLNGNSIAEETGCFVKSVDVE